MMHDLNIIDQFTETFVTFIESGFGLLSPDVAFLTTILIGIDITLAGLFWALSDDKNVIPHLIRKVLYVGAFAFIINNFNGLATVIFKSFAGLGLNATGTPLTIDNLMRPGFIAATGFDAALPILEEIGTLIGPIAFFENFPIILVLTVAFIVVILSFFILAIQLFITILEFKLTTLAGFVLIPFSLWNKTSFLAEKVIGNVFSAGIKLMVLAIIIGIGSTVFSTFTTAFNGADIGISQALSIMLGAIALLMLGIFGPGVAAGLITGAPQLGAGAVAGTALGLGVGAAAAGNLAMAGGRAAAAGVGGADKAGAATVGGAGAAFNLARAASGATGAAGVASGLAGVAQAGAGALRQGVRNAASRATSGVRSAYQAGVQGAFTATGGSLPDGASSGHKTAPGTPSGSNTTAPHWAHRLHRQHQAGTAIHAVRGGDGGSAANGPNLKEDEE